MGMGGIFYLLIFNGGVGYYLKIYMGDDVGRGVVIFMVLGL